MDKDENNYWHLRTPYDTAIVSKLHTPQEQLTHRNLFQLYMNTFLGASIAETCIFSMDASKTAHFTGFSTMILRNLIFHSCRVVLYEFFRRGFIYSDEDRQEMISMPAALMCGSAAGCIAQGLYTAYDLFKVEQQRSAASFGSVLKYFQGKVGVTRLRWELGTCCTHACLLTAGDVATYDLCKRKLKKHFQLKEELPLHLTSAVVAGLVASLLSHPAYMVRLRVLSQPVNEIDGKGVYYKGALECFLKLIKNEGAFSLYKNFVPCWRRLGSWSVVFWLSVEQLRLWEGQAGF